MSKYSIKDLERLTGIKAHTIRIWEQRYNLLSPERTDTNIRSYSNEELRRLLNVSMLNKCGFKISRIAEMEYDEISREAASLMAVQTENDDLINGLIAAMIDLDEPLFDSIIKQSFQRFGFQEAVISVIYPFMDRIGIMWQTGSINPAQEHFVSNLVRQKFIAAIDALPYAPKPDARCYLLFLPENELHEIGLLFYNYMIRSFGHRTLYLGQSVPFQDLERVVEIAKPDIMLTILTTPQEESAADFVKKLSDTFSHISIWTFGASVSMEGISSFANVLVPEKALDLLDRIRS